ncbi:MAG: carbohydrate kinase family protein [Proteobacteria bacterium]|uniref:carbohydrate kinase family protein n=1 Tax=Rudaea sp. TaxID=2136325 RepID=UPI0037832545|nr:carbohydrate kinase family protein [Pseudomonadota bacterium]
MKRVVVAGEINVDLIFTGVSELPRFGRETLAQTYAQCPGSSSMILAMGLARLGDPVRFVGRCGDDAFGRLCIDALRERGVDTTAVIAGNGLRTGVTVVMSSRTDRALLTWPGAIAELTAEDLSDDVLADAQHLHVSSYYLQTKLRPQLNELFARAHAAGLTTSLDPGSDPEQRWGRELIDLLHNVDVFMPNGSEACAISGTDTPEEALQALDNGRTRIVIKLGSRGATTLDAGKTLFAAAYATQAADTTGAGDSFNSGFLHAWLRDRPVLDCLRWGNACGGLSTRGIGGTATQGTAEEALALITAR